MKRQLAVLTRPGKRKPLTPGHALIIISTAGVGEEAYGFYPKDSGAVLEEIRQVSNDFANYNRSVVFDITDLQYKIIISEIDKWHRNNFYIPAVNDCTDFVLAMCKKAGLKVPSDSLWPDNLGKDFETLHPGKLGGGMCF